MAIGCTGAGGSDTTATPSESTTTSPNTLTPPATAVSPGARMTTTSLLTPPPTLAALSIAELPLVPAFSPSVHDYVVRCAAGANGLTVTATPSGDASASMVQPVAGGASAALRVLEDQAIVVQVENPFGATDQYWVRCLPHDFPSLAVGGAGSAAPGYYLLGNAWLGSDGDAGFAMVLDARGTPVWYRRVSGSPGWVSSPAKNAIAYSPILGPYYGVDPAGAFTILQLDTGTSTQVKAVGSALDHHELTPLANGDSLVLSYALTSGVDLSARGITATTTIADCEVQEIAPDGSLVWNWLASEHFDAAVESNDLLISTVNGAPVIDPFHCNSIDPAPSGDLLVSSRHMDAVFMISRATGKVLWKLGGVPSNKDGAQIVTLVGDAEGAFFHQHDARVLADGTITLFDNHTTAVAPARGMELTLDLATSSATTRWQYAASASSYAMGSYRRTADGSHMIGWGMLGNSKLAASEVDDAGTELFSLSFPAGDYGYRVVKAPLTSFDLDVLRSTAGGS
jgi:hypothetical protein